MGELWGVFCDFLDEKILRDIESLSISRSIFLPRKSQKVLVYCILLCRPPETDYFPLATEEALDVGDGTAVQAQQFQQWTVAQYSVQVLHKVSAALQVSDEQLLQHSLQLLQPVSVLLKEAVAAEYLWRDNSMAARELVRISTLDYQGLGLLSNFFCSVIFPLFQND